VAAEQKFWRAFVGVVVARAISGLSHPNICSLFDIGDQDGVHYVVLEYLEGVGAWYQDSRNATSTMIWYVDRPAVSEGAGNTVI
jgi:hypothetical protein